MAARVESRARWLELLEVVAKCPPDEAEAEWRWLMKELGLGPEYFLAVHEAILQGRWRTAEDPRAYVKTVAKREAVGMGIGEPGEAAAAEDDELVLLGGAEVDEERFSGEEMLEFVRYQQDVGRPVKGTDGVWRRGGGFGPDLEDPRGEYGSYRDFLLAEVPGELSVMEPPSEEMQMMAEAINADTDEVHIEFEPMRAPDWEKWAQEAGLSQWELRVVEYKLSGTSRERALAAQPDEESRKALQAAWRNLDRSGLGRLRAAAKKIF